MCLIRSWFEHDHNKPIIWVVASTRKTSENVNVMISHVSLSLVSTSRRYLNGNRVLLLIIAILCWLKSTLFPSEITYRYLKNILGIVLMTFPTSSECTTKKRVTTNGFSDVGYGKVRTSRHLPLEHIHPPLKKKYCRNYQMLMRNKCFYTSFTIYVM